MNTLDTSVADPY